MDPLVRIALRAARRAGPILLNTFDRPPASRMGRVALAEFTEWSQTNVFDVLRNEIQQAFPDHQIEDIRSQHTSARAQYVWKILPIDGLANFCRSIPGYCTLMGIYEHGQLAHSVVFDYVMDDEYWASIDAGARVGQHRMRISSAQQLKESLVAVVPPEAKEQRHKPICTELTTELGNEVTDTRRSGSTTIDTMHVANGKLDAILAFDIDAQMLDPVFLFIKEAGGYVYLEKGFNLTPGRVTLIGGSPKVFNQVSVLSRKLHKKALSELVSK